MNWALRQIGKRNRALNAKAIAAAERIQASGVRSAKWVSSDALRELRSSAVQARLRPVHTLLWRKYFVDELYDRIFVRPGYALGAFLSGVFEPRVLDGLATGVVSFVQLVAGDWRAWETGRVRRYALWTLGGAGVIAGYFAWVLLVARSAP